eukprot:1829628-Rhodomonas_salina.1
MSASKPPCNPSTFHRAICSRAEPESQSNASAFALQHSPARLQTPVDTHDNNQEQSDTTKKKPPPRF